MGFGPRCRKLVKRIKTKSMNIDDLKSSYVLLNMDSEEQVKLSFRRSVDGAIAKVQKQDAYDKSIILVSIFISIGACVYMLMNGINGYLAGASFYSYFGDWLLVVCILTGIPYFLYKRKKISSVDYSKPIVEFITEAEERFKFLHKHDLWIIPFLILWDLTLVVYLLGDLEGSVLSIILKSQGIVALVLSVSAAVSLTVWAFMKQPLLVELKQIKKSLE